MNRSEHLPCSLEDFAINLPQSLADRAAIAQPFLRWSIVGRNHSVAVRLSDISPNLILESLCNLVHKSVG